jgi:hypothetical protein
MDPLQNVTVYCAFCGEPIEVLVDCSIAQQEYVEDCQVCCHPLVMRVAIDDDGCPRVEVRNEND